MRSFALSVLGLAVLASGTVAQSTPITGELMWNGYSRPIQVVSAPGDPTRLYVVEQNQAQIEVIQNGTPVGTPMLNIAGLVTSGGNEQGLLGLAFHPDFQNNRYLYVNYTSNSGTVIRRFTGDAADPNKVVPGSGVQIMSFSQPQSNHNGGGLYFGPDGYLWIATGDGGNFNDTGTGHVAGGNAQSVENLLGKMLRIDVDGDDFPGDPDVNYAIPAGNPLVGVTGRDEIVHIGLRNPWRYSFDTETGDLWIGDVGQNAREEIDYLPRADIDAVTMVNWGWRCQEATACTGLSGCTCTDPGITGPIIEYNHSVGQSITGGRVYRGDAIPDLDGTYFYADYQQSKIFSLRYDGTTVTESQNRTAELDPPGSVNINRITDFGVGPDGELYISDLLNGEIFKIVPDGPFLGLGGALAGTNGEPVLYGTGGVGSGQPGALHVRNAVENKLAVAFASLTNNPAPFFGGTLVPGLPLTLSLNLFTNGAGEIDLAWTNLGANPSGLEIFLQFGFDDPGAVFGVSLSNALQATIP